MMNLKYKLLSAQAALMVGMMSADAHAANNFSDIARNINSSIEELPGLLTGVSYMMGLLFGVLGIMKIKDHVENPTQTPIKPLTLELACGRGEYAVGLARMFPDQNFLGSFKKFCISRRHA